MICCVGGQRNQSTERDCKKEQTALHRCGKAASKKSTSLEDIWQMPLGPAKQLALFANISLVFMVVGKSQGNIARAADCHSLF